jgi:hypothetical protein
MKLERVLGGEHELVPPASEQLAAMKTYLPADPIDVDVVGTPRNVSLEPSVSIRCPAISASRCSASSLR